jgi:hypothetical protein
VPGITASPHYHHQDAGQKGYTELDSPECQEPPVKVEDTKPAGKNHGQDEQCAQQRYPLDTC